MQGVTGIGHMAIRTNDLDRILDFYVNKLGFPEIFRLDREDGSLMLVYIRVTDEQFLEFFPNGVGEMPPANNVGFAHICLAVTDIEATIADITSRGVELSRPLKLGLDGNRQAWVTDPDGNQIELMEMAADSKQAEALARLRGR